MVDPPWEKCGLWLPPCGFSSTIRPLSACLLTCKTSACACGGWVPPGHPLGSVTHSFMEREALEGTGGQRWSLNLGSAFSGYGTPGFVLHLWGSASPSDASSQGIKKYDLVLCMRLVAQLCLALCDPMDCSPPLLCPWPFPGKNTGVGCCALL